MFFHLILQIEWNRNWFHPFTCIKKQCIWLHGKKWLESFQSGPGESPKIILCLMGCPDCLYVWLRRGAGKRDLWNKIFHAQMLWVHQMAGCALLMTDFLKVCLLGAGFECPSSWVDPLESLVNAAPPFCVLGRLPLCANASRIKIRATLSLPWAAFLISKCHGVGWLRNRFSLSRVGGQYIIIL